MPLICVLSTLSYTELVTLKPDSVQRHTHGSLATHFDSQVKIQAIILSKRVKEKCYFHVSVWPAATIKHVFPTSLEPHRSLRGRQVRVCLSSPPAVALWPRATLVGGRPGHKVTRLPLPHWLTSPGLLGPIRLRRARAAELAYMLMRSREDLGFSSPISAGQSARRTDGCGESAGVRGV